MLKKFFVLIILSMALTSNAFSFSDNTLSNFEYAKYGETYQYESLAERLNRLETDYFGMAQSGNIEERIDKLSKINRNSQPSNLFQPNKIYYNNKKNNRLKSFWNNLTSGFNDGFMTGYTPSMNTITTSGASNDIYRNNSFCPYNSNSQYRNFPRPYNYLNGVNRLTPYKRIGNNFQNPHNYNPNMKYNRPYVNRTSYFTPPNFETKSSIHILKD